MKSSPRILIFEPGRVGHRLTWLQYITEDFLHIGYAVTWAVDLRPPTKGLVEERLSQFLPGVDMLSVFSKEGKWRGGSKINALEECLRLSGAGDVFINEFDEIASNLLRHAALGIFPPPALQGCLSGVYFRPRFLTDPFLPLGNMIKASGFRRLCYRRWFKHLYFMDEYLFSALQNERGAEPFHFLPDPWSGDFSGSAVSARAALALPADKFVFLHYGIGSRRKGLHLAVDAMEKLTTQTKPFLLCAGAIDHDRRLLQRIAALENKGSARLLNRYISDAEERLCFCAADAVLLPYIRHYGSSGVLSRAAAAGRMVIVSDEGILAKRVQDHHLGLLFHRQNKNELYERMQAASTLNSAERDHFRRMSRQYAETCSRDAFRKALLLPWHPSPT